jgi:hypothetical protein
MTCSEHHRVTTGLAVHVFVRGRVFKHAGNWSIDVLCCVCFCVQVFGTPRGHHRVKPFFDHVLGLTHYVSLL